MSEFYSYTTTALKVFYYIAREIKSLFEFYLIPFLVVVLPHKIYYPFFRFICLRTFFYNTYEEGSFSLAKKYIPSINSNNLWKRNVKLLYLMDIADLWLVWLRPLKAKKLMITKGQWIKDKGFIALSSHWGTGFNSLYHLKMTGHKPYFVFLKNSVPFKQQSFAEKVYREIRRKYVNEVSGDRAISTGSAYENIRNKVLNNCVPVILLDAPKNKHESKYSLHLFKHEFPIASGYINLICEEKIPFQLYSMALDFNTGLRHLIINKVEDIHEETNLLTHLSQHLERLIIQSPEQWFFWRQSHEFLIKQIQQRNQKGVKISVLAYHSANILGNDYHNNDHVALEHDLELFKKHDIQIISAAKLIDWLIGKLTLDNKYSYVVLTFDDGNEMDFTDWIHPAFGMQKSFYSLMKNSNQYTHATAFVIASPEARKTLEKTYVDGHALLGEDWWSKAEDSGLISIENHSWDHVHPTIDFVKQKNNIKENFALIDNTEDANNQILNASHYIENVVNKEVILFGYPYGHYNSFLTDEYFPHQQNRIIAAFTCDPEHVTRETNLWKIPRFVCGHNWKTPSDLKDIIL